LREPGAALAAAHALVVFDGPLPEADERRLERWAPDLHRVTATRVARTLRPLGGGPSASPASLHGRDVGMLCGIARPLSFRRTLEALGARVVAERSFPDHHRYRPTDLRGLGNVVPRWVTTEKDAVKLDPDWVPGAEILVLGSGLRVSDADSFLSWLEEALATRGQASGAE
jgi:tetraacyldisaccharide-1-P 4'-kinase